MLEREQLPPAYADSCSDNSRTLFELDSLRLISETAVYKKGSLFKICSPARSGALTHSAKALTKRV